MIEFGNSLKDYGFARRKEYLLTVGDAYCSSSLAGNTRKYHGMLVANRRVYLSGLDEHINDNQISVARYLGARQDEGLRFLDGFELYPPQFYYMVNGTAIKKTILFDGELCVRYDVTGEADFHIRPLITDRGYHEVRRDIKIEPQSFDHHFTTGKLAMWSNLPFRDDRTTYYDVFYERDEERGYDHTEDLYSPGYFHGKVKDGHIILCASVEGVSKSDVNILAPSTTQGSLDKAAMSFVVDDEIYAGYHWFAEPWGRDTFVSLPGLLLERGEYDTAKRVFRRFAGYMKKGLIPNRIPGGYNSSDAPLWFIYALGKYFEKTEDSQFYRDSKGYVEDILSGYPNSEIAKLDGPLVTVAPETTWMDTPHTGRSGKPVEVNALWINALRLADKMGLAIPVKPDNAIKEFERFWNDEKGCLYDLIDPIDASVRPNQTIAIALAAVEGERAKSAIEVVRNELLTPYGLRTLSSTDSRYIGKFSGDASYHNGCVWPWLMGFYIEAQLKLGEPADKMMPLLKPLLIHTHDAGLGTISEIFDGDTPHEPGGCISQAWSVAEVLRAYHLLQR